MLLYKKLYHIFVINYNVSINLLEPIMPITNTNTLVQALANIRLESLSLSEDIKELLNKALTDPLITTDHILVILRSK